MRRSITALVSIGLLLFCLSACADPACEKDNDALRAMPASEITITRADGTSITLNGKLADHDTTRAAGFQRVCESTIESSPILFEFQYPLRPKFHMNNVVAPIDIAFIDQQGRIDSIHNMKPYVLGSNKKPLYGSKRPIIAALEVHQGFFDQHEVDLSSIISWRKPSP